MDEHFNNLRSQYTDLLHRERGLVDQVTDPKAFILRSLKAMQDHTDLCNDSIQAGNAIGLVGNTSGTNWLYSKDKKCHFVILKKILFTYNIIQIFRLYWSYMHITLLQFWNSSVKPIKNRWFWFYLLPKIIIFTGVVKWKYNFGP